MYALSLAVLYADRQAITGIRCGGGSGTQLFLSVCVCVCVCCRGTDERYTDVQVDQFWSCVCLSSVGCSTGTKNGDYKR